MRTRWGEVEIRVSMQVSEILALVNRRWGSVAKLRTYLDKEPDDPPAFAFWRAVTDDELNPSSVIHFTEIILGAPAEVLAAGKLQLLGYLMGHPGVGVRQLARGLGKNPATVLEQVLQLEEAGLVLKDSKGPGKPASIRPLVRELNIRLSAERPARALT